MSEDDINQYPIITYTNRLQRQMEKITTVMNEQSTSLAAFVNSLRMLIANLPPQARTQDLKDDYNKLVQYDHAVGSIRSKVEVEQIYMKVHDWCYKNLFQDAFKFRPKNPNLARIGKREQESQSE